MGMHQNFTYSARTNPDLPLCGFAEDPDVAPLVSTALDQNRLLCAFQPVEAASGGRVAFYECLARLRGPEGQVLSAASFMPNLPDETVTRIDSAMLQNAVDIIAADPVRRLSVNLSPASIGNAGWLRILENAVKGNPSCGELLIIEITESSVLSLDKTALEFLHHVRQLGCSIAIDDFGGGHTSLQFLGKFRFDFLKIDGAFVRDVSQDEDHQFLIKSMISIARHFEMVTVAEMVGSAEDRRLLTDFGIDCVQGYGIGKPILYPDWLQSGQLQPGY